MATDNSIDNSAIAHSGSAGEIFFSASDMPASQPKAIIERPVRTSTTMVLFQEPDLSRAAEVRRFRANSRSENSSSSASEKRVNLEIERLEGDGAVKTSTGESGDTELRDAPKRSRRGNRGSRGGRKNTDTHTNTDDAVVTSNNAEISDNAPSSTSQELSEDNPDRNVGKTGDSAEQASDTIQAGKKGSTRKRSRKATAETPSESAVDTAVAVRKRRRRVTGASGENVADQVTAPKGSTRLEAKRQRRKEGREAGRRRHTITESEFLARRESVDRHMLVREHDGLNQIAVLEDGVLVEHYVARHTQTSMVGNVYLGRVQNVLPSMEAAFVDIGKGRNAVLYAGEVNWDVAGLEGKPRRIEEALKSGDTVLVQVTKDPIGHKGARLTSQITLAGRHLVLVPGGAMTGISRKLPEKERARLKKILCEIVPGEHGVIVRTAAEGASEDQLRNDVDRLTKAWKDIQGKAKSSKNAPSLLKGEPELAVRVVRDVFNEDFNSLQIQGEKTWETICEYVQELSPELVARVQRWEKKDDIFRVHRVDEQLAKAFDRKVYLPSGGTLVIDRTEAMTVIDVNTGKFTGAAGGSLEETVTKNNLEAAEEIVRQLRLRDIGGIVVIDFIDMVLEANRDLVLRRLIECLGRDRTRHQVAEVTSLGLVQMTRKRVGQGLVEAFSTTCETCEGRGYITYDHPIEKGETPDADSMVVGRAAPPRREHGYDTASRYEHTPAPEPDPQAEAKQAEVKAALNSIAAAAANKHAHKADGHTAMSGNAPQAGKRTKKTGAGAVPSKAPGDPEILGDVGGPAEFELRPERKTARPVVTSSGTITPTSSAPASSFIMTFPKKGD